MGGFESGRWEPQREDLRRKPPVDPRQQYRPVSPDHRQQYHPVPFDHHNDRRREEYERHREREYIAAFLQLGSRMILSARSVGNSAIEVTLPENATLVIEGEPKRKGMFVTQNNQEFSEKRITVTNIAQVVTSPDGTFVVRKNDGSILRGHIRINRGFNEYYTIPAISIYLQDNLGITSTLDRNNGLVLETNNPGTTIAVTKNGRTLTYQGRAILGRDIQIIGTKSMGNPVTIDFINPQTGERGIITISTPNNYIPPPETTPTPVMSETYLRAKEAIKNPLLGGNLEMIRNYWSSYEGGHPFFSEEEKQSICDTFLNPKLQTVAKRQFNRITIPDVSIDSRGFIVTLLLQWGGRDRYLVSSQDPWKVAEKMR